MHRSVSPVQVVNIVQVKAALHPVVIAQRGISVCLVHTLQLDRVDLPLLVCQLRAESVPRGIIVRVAQQPLTCVPQVLSTPPLVPPASVNVWPVREVRPVFHMAFPLQRVPVPMATIVCRDQTPLHPPMESWAIFVPVVPVVGLEVPPLTFVTLAVIHPCQDRQAV